MKEVYGILGYGDTRRKKWIPPFMVSILLAELCFFAFGHLKGSFDTTQSLIYVSFSLTHSARNDWGAYSHFVPNESCSSVFYTGVKTPLNSMCIEFNLENAYNPSDELPNYTILSTGTFTVSPTESSVSDNGMLIELRALIISHTVSQYNFIFEEPRGLLFHGYTNEIPSGPGRAYFLLLPHLPFERFCIPENFLREGQNY